MAQTKVNVDEVVELEIERLLWATMPSLRRLQK